MLKLDGEWAKKLVSKETLEKLLNIGDGHDIIPPEVYKETGLDQKIINRFTRVHESRRIPSLDLVGLVSETIQDVLDECDEHWFSDTVALREELTEQITESIAHGGFKNIWDLVVFSPTESIYSNGEVVDRLEGVHSLDLVEAVAKSLNLTVESRLGRGSRFQSAQKAF